MTDSDQTVVLPRQSTTPPEESREDPWQATATGSAPVDGFAAAPAALTRLSWLLTTILMAAAGLARAGWASLSGDELATWALATTPWPELWALRAELDMLTAGYIALIRAWAEVFGASEISLRLPSVLAMAAAAGAIAALVSRLAGPRAGMLTGLLFVTVPVTSRYAHEAGPHALACAFAVLATMALVGLFERPGAWRALGYGAAVAALGLAYPAALLLVLGHLAATLMLRRRAAPWCLPAAVLGAAPAVSLLFLGRPPWQLAGAQEPAGMPDVAGAAAMLVGGVLLGGVIVGLALLAVSGRKPAGVFTAGALAPLLGLFPVAEFTGGDPAAVMIVALPFWLALAAMALGRAPIVRGLLVVVLAAALAVPVHLDIRTDDGHGLAARQVAAVLTERGEPGDAILFGPTRLDERTGRDLVERYVPEQARPADVLAEAPPRAGGQLLAPECVEVDRCVGDAPRVWLLRAGVSDDPLAGLPAAKDGLLRVRYELERTWTFQGATLALFALLPAELDRPAPR